jgi:hypothetical protein
LQPQLYANAHLQDGDVPAVEDVERAVYVHDSRAWPRDTVV